MNAKDYIQKVLESVKKRN